MTHASMDPDARRRAGIDDSLLRLSAGIESARDLKVDVHAALDCALQTKDCKNIARVQKE